MTTRELKKLLNENIMLYFYEPHYGRDKFGYVEMVNFKITISAKDAVMIARLKIWNDPHYQKKDLPAYKLLDYFMTNHGARVVEGD